MGDRLDAYRSKRRFEASPEPPGEVPPEPASSEPHFVVHKHAARRLHYDFRIEADGVLVSWAVPKGPSYDPKVKRLAVHVEDHPLDYETFEGVIPEGHYGAGSVVVWDRGTYRNLTRRRGKPMTVADAVRHGHLSLWLEGSKLKGGWTLNRIGEGDTWLLVKRADDLANPDLDVVATHPTSVKSGRTVEQVAEDPSSESWSAKRAVWVPPMLAQPLRHSDLGLITGQDWRYEIKLDGLRCIAVRNDDRVELWSRNHQSLNERFSHICTALARLPATSFTMDGEIVVFVEGRSSFAELQRSERSTDSVYCVFDLMHLLGRDTRGLPLKDRQDLLARTVEGGGTQVRVVENMAGDPAALLDQTCKRGWEGLIAKRLSSPYRAGRSPAWRKVKCSASQELVIVGWTEPSGSRIGFGALLMGYYDSEGQLHYAGKVGTGFDQRTLHDLGRRLASMEVASPPVVDPVDAKGVHWVHPELVAAVSFTEWTEEGRLRHPSFQGLRTDKAAREVHREDPK